MMKTTALLGTVFVLAISLAHVQAQTNPNVPAAVQSPAPAGVTGQAIVPQANGPQPIPETGPSPINRLEQTPITGGAIVVPNTAAPVATDVLSDEVRARYQWQNGHWWYQMADGSWMYHTNGQWVAFHPGTYSVAPAVAPQTYAPQAGAYGTANNGGNYSGSTYANPGYGYYQGSTGYASPGYGPGYYSRPGYSGYGYGAPGYGNSSAYGGYGGVPYGSYYGAGYPGYGYYNPGAAAGGSLGSQIGGQIGGFRGAAVGGNIGAQIGGNLNQR